MGRIPNSNIERCVLEKLFSVFLVEAQLLMIMQDFFSKGNDLK